MPTGGLRRIEWTNEILRHHLQSHLSYYDYPGHYLRVTLLFEKAFWRSRVSGTYFMSDAFGGCCLYDEGKRHPGGKFAALGWLLAGNDALENANKSDADLARMVLDSTAAETGALSPDHASGGHARGLI